MSAMVRLCIAGGGTGGHVMPALALADAMRAHNKDVSVSFIGAERGLEATLLPERGEDVMLLNMHSVQGAGLLQKIKVLLWELPQSVVKIRSVWKVNKPTVLVGVGGYASVAGVVAALLSRIPVVLYEQNAIPGLVNRVLYRFCDVMMLGFASATKHLPHTQKAVVRAM
jgi:UDP-N-acetylglucosamine--N-acetylmuramyl-(pentapeptide) pyrophosphoryl-undecaprenol N-acetylglucosamine transferase